MRWCCCWLWLWWSPGAPPPPPSPSLPLTTFPSHPAPQGQHSAPHLLPLPPRSTGTSSPPEGRAPTDGRRTRMRPPGDLPGARPRRTHGFVYPLASGLASFTPFFTPFFPSYCFYICCWVSFPSFLFLNLLVDLLLDLILFFSFSLFLLLYFFVGNIPEEEPHKNCDYAIRAHSHESRRFFGLGNFRAFNPKYRISLLKNMEEEGILS